MEIYIDKASVDTIKTKINRNKSYKCLLEATRKVYAEHGYHQTTVEMILEQAGVSRPTFYKFFDSKHQIIEIIVKEAHSDLRKGITQIIQNKETLEQRLIASLDAYIDWGEEKGKFASTLYRELGDPRSPVTKHIKLFKKDLASFWHSEFKKANYKYDVMFFESILTAIEYVGSQLFLIDTTKAMELRDRHRAVMVQLIGALLMPQLKDNGKK